MSLLNLNLNEVPDEITVPDDEYQLVITKAEQKESKTGNPMIEVFFNIISEPDAKMIAHYMLLPTKGDKNANNKLRRLKSFYLAAKLDLAAEINVEEDFKGIELWAQLTTEDDDEYGARNRIKRFVEPK